MWCGGSNGVRLIYFRVFVFVVMWYDWCLNGIKKVFLSVKMLELRNVKWNGFIGYFGIVIMCNVSIYGVCCLLKY